MRNYRHIEVKPIAGALGAEIHGVDMSRELRQMSSPRCARPCSIIW